jgi:cell surface protein SprA
MFGLFGEAGPAASHPGAVADFAMGTLFARQRRRLGEQWRASTLQASASSPVGIEQSGIPLGSPWATLMRRAPVTTIAPTGRSSLASAMRRVNVLVRDTVPALADLNFELTSRLESRIERNRNERCTAFQLSSTGSNCRGVWQPAFNFQFGLLSNGSVADRVHIDIDYDTQREFDASNNISVRYEGKPNEAVQSIEVGNISFNPPPSRFLTSGIPAGNYGIQAKGHLGPMRITTLFAQQKGNVTKDRTFIIGDRALQQESRVIEDVGIEQRRFFFTVNPRRLPGYPNLDILNRSQMQRAAASLPDSVRPFRVFVYKQLVGAVNPNPRGPQLAVRGARNSARQIYEVLRENVDYYLDPSGLWIALVQQLGTNERLAVAYEIKVNGVVTRNVNTGGTPDIEFTVAPQFANLLWEKELQPGDTAGYFQREIKSVYRLGGEELQRSSIAMRVVTGTSGDQEKPVDQSRGATYLQLFGLAQPTNPGEADIENHVWPRAQDPNRIAGTATQKLIRDNFLVFPSLQPFARAGLAQPFANPANDTLYTYPNEYLYSSQRPPSIFRVLVAYLSAGLSGTSSLSLQALQVRPQSERVLLDGQQLVRDVDYTVNYDLGQINFNRPDTLFLRPRQVVVRFEENQQFETSPTSIFALSTQFPLQNGQVSFTAISQQQRSNFNRPTLGFEPQGSLLAGVTANFTWDATALTHALNRLPFAPSSIPSRIGFNGEIALSRPTPNSAGLAYLESFEGNSGISIRLPDDRWALSSQPAAGSRLGAVFGYNPLTLNRVSTLAFQSVVLDQNFAPLQFTIDQIDPSVKLEGTGFQGPEPMLWLSLYPLKTGGFSDIVAGTNSRVPRWTIGSTSALGPTPSGRRWGSIRYVLDPSGLDLSRAENIEFFALVRTDAIKRRKNPTVILDFGDISENRVAFTPETLTVNAPARAGLKPDTTYGGKRLAGYDRLDSERDKFSRTFNAVDNDVGIAGSVADSIIVVDHTTGSGAPVLAQKVPLCSANVQAVQVIGDSRANCTVHNNRLDEEDIDLDGQLNLRGVDTDREQWKRFAVDLSDDRNWTRVGKCRAVRLDSSTASGAVADTLCWVQVRLNWRAPLDSLNAPGDRRMRALRLTMVSAAGAADDEMSRVAIAKLNIVSAPWLRRSERPLSGIAGDSASFTNGYVISSLIGTEDSSATLHYQPPPGVVEQVDSKSRLANGAQLVQVNEHSLRLQAGVRGAQFPTLARAEAYLRFPEGNKSFMGYRSLRVWMRGRGNGWGTNGELNAFIKIGRDENNFYLYRTPVQAGETVGAWEPEVRVDLTRFQALRAQLENNTLASGADSLACTGTDLELIRRSGLPRGVVVRRYAVCNAGYVVYSADPAVTPPNLAGVQEMAVGFVRVDSVARSGNAIMPSDTLELWVDDVRLGDVVDDVGFAGEVGFVANAGDFADFRVNLSRRDPNFRQLGENPTFLTATGVTAGTTLHLERMLPRRLGIVMPMTIAYGGTGIDQLFITQTDVRANGINGLRNPHDSRVDYAVSVRRRVPLTTGWYANVLNGLALNAIWGRGTGRSAFQDSRNANYAVSAVLNLASLDADPGGSVSHLPGIIDRILGALPAALRESEAIRGLRAQRVRWRPSRFQLTSGLGRSYYTTTSYLKPAFSANDTGRAVESLSHLWQISGNLEFRPIHALTAAFTARQTLDLRDYRGGVTVPDSINRGVAAMAERLKFFGAGLGLERERSINSLLDFHPGVADWLQPNVRFSGNFGLYRDPNAPSLLRSADGARLRLPKRMGALQTLDAGLGIDASRLLTTRSAPGTKRYALGHALLPITISWTRTLASNYDFTALAPGVAYQLGVGGQRAFRGGAGALATGAARVSNVSASGAILLPLSLTVASNVQHGSSATWTLRAVDDFQALITNTNTTYPDVSANWRWRAVKPNKLLSSLSLSAGYRITENNTLALSQSGATAEQGAMRYVEHPLSGEVSWSIIPGLVTAATYNPSSTSNTRPGSVTRDHPVRQSYTVSKPFRLPAQWKTRTGLMVRTSYLSESAISLVEDAPGTNSLLFITGAPSILTNNGLKRFNFSADTELANSMTFSVSGSHAVVFDRNYNRRTSQSVLSAVLQMKFGSGDVH